MRLAQLIDLELAVARDAERPIEELIERDRRVAGEIDAGERDGAELFLAWLERVRRPGEPSAGERIEHFRDGLGALLLGLGLLSGATTVGAWLAMSDRLPVNVTNFWPALVGSQLALLVLWCVAVLPPTWVARVPGLRGPQLLLSALARALPTALGALVSRISSQARDTLFRDLARLRRLDWLYGRLRFWLTVSLTQTFTLAFNVGAVAAFVFLPYVDDPAFGWRSRLLEPESLHALTQWIAWPWAGVYPDGTMALEQVRATRYSSVAPALAASTELWAAWWPFLLASLVAYGLLPRGVLWAVARWRSARALAGVSLDHAELERLRVRLQGPFVDTRALEPEGEPPGLAGGREPAALALDGLPCTLLRWWGVDLEEDALRQRLQQTFGASVERVCDVGGLEPDADAAALRATAGGEGPVLVAVAAYEPPVGDHVDFLRRARGTLAPERPLVVLLCRTEAASAAALGHWRQALAGLADPYLFVQALGSPAAA